MSLLNRVLLLTALSISGIALIAPLAARSAATPLEPAIVGEALLPASSPAPGTLDRGALSSRGGTVDATASAAETLRDRALPKPASAPMEATLHSVATPPPAPTAAPASRAPRATIAPAPRHDGGDSVWDDLAQCESGGNWSINTGNGYYGGLQFNYGTWHDYGGAEFADYPHQATREEQIVVAERLRDARGYAPWPACRAKLGLP